MKARCEYLYLNTSHRMIGTRFGTSSDTVITVTLMITFLLCFICFRSHRLYVLCILDRQKVITLNVYKQRRTECANLLHVTRSTEIIETTKQIIQEVHQFVGRLKCISI